MGQILAQAGNFARNIGFQIKKNSPAILVGTGIVGGLAGTVLACIATVKAKPVIDDAKKELEDIQNTTKNDELYTESDAKKDRYKLYFNTAGKLVKIYAPAVLIEAGSIGCILGGTGILNKRNASLGMALAASTTTFKEYRERLIEKFGDEGEEIDKELRYGVKKIEVKEKIVDENGKEKTVKTIKNVVDGNVDHSNDYCRVFDWTNPYWQDDLDYVMMFLRAQQSYLNDKLRVDGHLFLNDVLKTLGFPTTRVGQEVGWIYDSSRDDSDGFVDFGIYEACVDVEGIRKVIMLDFNVDGSIINRVNWPDQK
jgi:hypothetical protein